MDCVCGCGRDLPKSLGDRNFIAAGVALELLAWDKNRALPGSGPAGREGLIARGVVCYEQLLESLHGEASDDPDADANAWLRQSGEMRAGRSDMTKRRFFGPAVPNLSKEDMDRLDRSHPERSFTGDGADASGETAPAAAPSPPADNSGAAPSAPADLVDQLERLRALRDADVLTEEEFAAAKDRLLRGN